MAENSNIAWTDHTFNPWMGCQKVSHECDHCYADALTSGRMGLEVFGGKSKRKRTSAGLWKRPAKWNRESAEDLRAGGRVHRVFCASLADVFEDAPGPNEWRADVWDLIRACPWLDFQLLTKRPELVAGMLPDDWGEGWPHVWLGTSIGHRETVERARILAAVPAFRRFISYEPAIGPVFFDSEQEIGDPYAVRGVWSDGFDGPELELDGIDWLIAGGESGPGHRSMAIEWAEAARGRCDEESVAFFFKQNSGPRPGMGEDALGAIYHEFPPSWDRAELNSPPTKQAVTTGCPDERSIE